MKVLRRFERKQTTHENDCLCRNLLSVLWLCRLLGVAPLSLTHKPSTCGKPPSCCFKISVIWVIYSILITLCYIAHLTIIINTIHKTDFTLISVMLFNQVVYTTVAMVIPLLNILSARKLAGVLNDVCAMCNDDWPFWSDTMRRYKCFQGFALLVLFLYISMHVFVHFWITSRHEHPIFIHFGFVTNKIANAISIVFAFEFFAICSLYKFIFVGLNKAMYVSFEDKLKRGGPLQVCPALSRVLLSFTTGREAFVASSTSEVLERYRQFHELICRSLRKANVAFNPQLLVHFTSQLVVNVTHCYLIVQYILSEDDLTGTYKVMHYFDWMCVLTHTVAVFGMLIISEDIRTQSEKPLEYLLLLSVQHLKPEEQMQVRLFIAKFEMSPAKLSASGVYGIGLPMLGPVVGIIITYVLVTLQFRIASV